MAGFGEDVDSPTRQLGCEPHVLSSAADRFRQLIVGHDEFHAVRVLIDEYSADIGGGDRVDNEARWIGMEWDDVDGFAAKFLNDCLDPRTLQSDTGSNRVDVAVHAGDGNLCAVSRFACACLDADNSLVDLGNLKFEQLHQQSGVNPTQHDLRGARRARDVEHVCLNPVALTVRLGLDLLALGKDGLCASEVDNNVALFETANDTGDEFAFSVLKLVEGHFSFGITNLLDDDLFCSLSSDAAQVFDADFDAEGVTHFALGVGDSGQVDADFGLVVPDFFNHGSKLEEFDLTEILIELGFEVALHTEALSARGDHGAFQHLNKDIPRNVLFTVNGVHQTGEIANHDCAP